MDQFRAHRNYEVSGQIEALINAWLELQDKQRQLDSFQAERQPPAPPEQFDSVDSLMEFDQEKQDYESSLGGFRGRLQDAQRAFEQQAGRWYELLPEGIPLIHEYQTYGSGPVGKRFKIVWAPSGETSQVQIEELDE